MSLLIALWQVALAYRFKLKKNPRRSPSLSLSLSFPFLNLPPSLSSVLILLVRVQEGRIPRESLLPLPLAHFVN